MHIIENYSAGTIQIVESCERAWPMPTLQQSNSRWLRRDFPGQYAIGTTHGGRGGEVVKSFHVIECSEEIYRAATEASGGSDGFTTDCGRFGVLPGTGFAKQAKAWQARCRRAATKAKKQRIAEQAKAEADKAKRIAEAQCRAAEFSGEVADWLVEPFQPAPAVVVAAKQASGLSWAEFMKLNKK